MLIFSKNRTLQLASFLESMKWHNSWPGKVTVLFSSGGSVSYRNLIDTYRCLWWYQDSGDDGFYWDLKKWLSQAKDLICFCVDDSIMLRPVNWPSVEYAMNRSPAYPRGVDCFNLRNGLNILDDPAPWREKGSQYGTIEWQTGPDMGKNWNYFFNLAGSVYHKDHVLEYFDKLKPEECTFPNPFESLYYDRMPSFLGSGRRAWWTNVLNRSARSKWMASYTSSRIVQVQWNVVHDQNPYKDTKYTVEHLHKMYLEGYLIDFKNMVNYYPTGPNRGAEVAQLKQGVV